MVKFDGVVETLPCSLFGVSLTAQRLITNDRAEKGPIKICSKILTDEHYAN